MSGNLVTGNADGLLISDETAESHNNLVTHNVFRNNPLECGTVLASHPPMGTNQANPPYSTAHYGVDNNSVADNISTDNGVQIGGSGVGIFADGIGPGKVTGNVVIWNQLTGNGLGGVAIHTHVGSGPAFGGPHLPDDMEGNVIIGNVISGNLADFGDTATPGSVGITINSGEGGTPILGTTISGNVIRDEDVDIVINTSAEVDIHLNDLLGGKVGVADVCSFDYRSNNYASYIPTFCTEKIDASENYFGSPAGANARGRSTTSGDNVIASPALDTPVVPVGNNDHNE